MHKIVDNNHAGTSVIMAWHKAFSTKSITDMKQFKLESDKHVLHYYWCVHLLMMMSFYDTEFNWFIKNNQTRMYVC